MTDRLQEIRARLDAWNEMDAVEQSLTHPEDYVADIAWLLDEVSMLRMDIAEIIRKADDTADWWKQEAEKWRDHRA